MLKTDKRSGYKHTKLAASDEETNTLQAQKEGLNAQKKGLMQRLLSREVRVKID